MKDKFLDLITFTGGLSIALDILALIVFVSEAYMARDDVEPTAFLLLAPLTFLDLLLLAWSGWATFHLLQP